MKLLAITIALFCCFINVSQSLDVNTLASRAVEHLKSQTSDDGKWLTDLLEIDDTGSVVPKSRSKRFLEYPAQIRFAVSFTNVAALFKKFSCFAYTKICTINLTRRYLFCVTDFDEVVRKFSLLFS